MRTRLLQALLFAGLAGGCTGTGAVQYGASASVTTPELVYVSPGVQVIADYDEPVFYSDNYYWRYNNNVWYRSQYHTRGWVRVESPPVAVRRIDRPQTYIRYRGNARADVRTPVRSNADRERMERERLERERAQDRREDRRELIQDRNQERQEDRRELLDQREDQREAERKRLLEQREREAERRQTTEQRDRQRDAERKQLLDQRERQREADRKKLLEQRNR